MGKHGRTFTQVISRLRQAISCNRLLPSCSRLLVALSGGQDSLALADSLSYLHNKQKWEKLSVVHCDHRWPHDVGNADLVQRYAKQANIQLHLIDALHSTKAVGMTEGAAREWRYAELAQLARREGYDCVVTGHTRTDLAETVLFNLSHGAGSDGLCALTWDRALCDGVRLARPFLNVSRAETGAYCAERSLQVWHDSYNEDCRYARNRIRAHVMPMLKTLVNHHVEEALARTAHLLRDEMVHLEGEADAIRKRVVVSCMEERGQQTMEHRELDTKVHSFPCSIGEHASKQIVSRVVVLDQQGLKRASVAMQRRVIRCVLQRYVGLSYDGSTFAQVEAVRSLLHAKEGCSTASLSGNGSAVVTAGQTITLTSSPNGVGDREGSINESSIGEELQYVKLR